MQKIRKFTVFLLIPLHLLIYPAEFQNGALFFGACLLALLADFALSFRDLRIFTAKRGKIGVFAHDFLPHLGKKALIAAADFVIYLILNATQHHEFDGFIFDNEMLWFSICIAELICGLLVSFVTGAASTMLHHDDTEKR